MWHDDAELVSQARWTAIRHLQFLNYNFNGRRTRKTDYHCDKFLEDRSYMHLQRDVMIRNFSGFSLAKCVMIAERSCLI